MSKTQSNPKERPSETAKKVLRAKSGEETAEISATAPIRAQEFDPHFKHEVRVEFLAARS